MRDFDPSLIHLDVTPLVKIGSFGKIVPIPRDLSTGLSIGGSLLGGVFGDKGAEGQADAANQAGALAAKAYQDAQKNLSPFLKTGQASNNLLSYYLGLSNTPTGGVRNALTAEDLVDTSQGDWRPNQELYQADANYRKQWDKFIKDHMAQYGVNPNLSRGSDLAKTQNYFANLVDLNSYNKNLNDPSVAADDDRYGRLLREFTGENLQNEPGYQFRLGEGQKGVERGAAARGGLLSGSALKAIQRFGQDYASNEYQNAFNRDAANKNQIYTMLTGTSGAGQNAASQLGQLGANSAAQQGNYMTQAANANAAGNMAWGNAIGGATDAYRQYNILNRILK